MSNNPNWKRQLQD
jgi:putative ABC transport system substrate-binding protein